MRPIVILLDAVARIVERLLPGRAGRFAAAAVLIVAILAITYVASFPKLARWQ